MNGTREGRRGPVYFGSLEKKRPQLGVGDGEPWRDLDLRAVRFDLRKIGVVGEVEGQIRREPVFDIDAALPIGARWLCCRSMAFLTPRHEAVNVGSSSRLRLIDRPVIPSSASHLPQLPITSATPATSTTLSFLLRCPLNLEPPAVRLPGPAAPDNPDS